MKFFPTAIVRLSAALCAIAITGAFTAGLVLDSQHLPVGFDGAFAATRPQSTLG